MPLPHSELEGLAHLARSSSSSVQVLAQDLLDLIAEVRAARAHQCPTRAPWETKISPWPRQEPEES